MSLIPIDEAVYFDVTTHDPTTGAVSDADSAPTFDVFEEATDTPILDDQSMTKRTSLTGNYRGTFTASAANGFEAGKWYSVVVSATVDSIAAKHVAKNFRVAPAESSAGVPKTDVTHFGGSAGTFASGIPAVNTTQIEGSDATDQIRDAVVDDATRIDGSALNTLSGHDPGETIMGATDTVVLTDGSLTAAKIASDAITAAKIADGAIDAATFAAGAINAAAIAADAITDAKVASDVTIASVTGSVGSVATGGITAASFAAGAIDAAAIAADAIGSSELAASAITEIQSGLSTLDAAGVRTAVGLASANLDTQLDALPTAAENADAVWDESTTGHTTAGTFGEQAKTDIDAILVDTAEIGAAGAGLTEAGGTGDHLTAVPWNASWDAEVQSEVQDALDATIADSIPADGTRPSISQALYMLTQFMLERSVSSTTVTVKKVDGSTSLFTLTLDDATSPTSITRAS